jgi:DHA1 family bicyclomycin/chloramphenicol resistance-like MFS transporter
MNLSRSGAVERTTSFVEGRGFVLLLGALTALDPLTIDMYLPVFGDVQRSLHTTPARVELSVSTFFVGMAVGQLFYGPLADRFGRRRPLLGGMAVYFLATIGCALSPGIRSFLAFRFLEALGGCAGLVITRAVVRDVFGKQRAASFLSSMALVMGVAPVLAPSLGALIGAHLGWRALFLVLAVANAACMGSVFVLLPETGTPATARLRLSSAVLAYGGLLRDRKFVGYLVPDTAIRAGMFAYIAGSSFVFIHLFHLSASAYGLLFGLNGCGLMLASQVNRRLLKTFSPDRILGWSVNVGAVCAALVFVCTWAGAPRAVILASIFVFIATLNFVSPNSLASAMASQGHQAGTASALYGSLQWSMATGSSFLVGTLHNGTAFPMTGVMLFCGLVSLGAFHLLVTPTRRAEPL